MGFTLPLKNLWTADFKKMGREISPLSFYYPVSKYSVMCYNPIVVKKKAEKKERNAMQYVIENLSDDELWRAYESQKEMFGRFADTTQLIAVELEKRGYDLYPITADDYKEWAAASRGTEYII